MKMFLMLGVLSGANYAVGNVLVGAALNAMQGVVFVVAVLTGGDRDDWE